MVAVATEDCAVVDSPYWLHAGCRIVRVVSVGGGRGVVASEAIEPGALVLEEPAYLIAESYEAMLDRLQEISDDPVIRDMHPVGTGVERLPDVIAHNWHKPDPEIVEGEVGASVRRERGDFGPLGTTAAGGSRTVKKLPGGSILGLWPKGSLINHKFGRPNLARSFVVKEEPGPEGSWHEVLYVQYRCIRTVCAGEELLDNYMDLLSPFSRRLEVERNQHGMMCRPDELDHPRTPEWLQRASAGLEASSPADAVSLLAPVCREFMPGGEEARDPALWPPIFELGRALQALRLWPQALGVYAHALKLVMAREPFSVCTCRTLAVLCGCYCARLKAIAADVERQPDAMLAAAEPAGAAAGELAGAREAEPLRAPPEARSEARIKAHAAYTAASAELAASLTLAKTHFTTVFGDGGFEALNPTLGRISFEAGAALCDGRALRIGLEDHEAAENGDHEACAVVDEHLLCFSEVSPAVADVLGDVAAQEPVRTLPPAELSPSEHQGVKDASSQDAAADWSIFD